MKCPPNPHFFATLDMPLRIIFSYTRLAIGREIAHPLQDVRRMLLKMEIGGHLQNMGVPFIISQQFGALWVAAPVVDSICVAAANGLDFLMCQVTCGPTLWAHRPWSFFVAPLFMLNFAKSIEGLFNLFAEVFRHSAYLF